MRPPGSARLDFVPLTVEAPAALIGGDRNTLEATTGARFPEPLTAPQEIADALPAMRDALLADPASGRWGPFLIVLRSTGEAAGSAGFMVRPDDAGTIVLGYSVYPSLQRRGIATEAAQAFVSWALAQPGIRRL